MRDEKENFKVSRLVALTKTEKNIANHRRNAYDLGVVYKSGPKFRLGLMSFTYRRGGSRWAAQPV
jgi:hypothetical protein